MDHLRSVIRLVITAVLIAAGAEGGYRLSLFLKHPNNFRAPETATAAFSIWNTPPWQYDPDYGYGYVPSLKVDNTHITGGLVTGCGEFGLANEQGNLGPPVLDFDDADVRIVVFGDSFAGAYVTGPAWTKILGERLERELGKTVRVLNMARDGYGMPQIVALASGKLKELRVSAPAMMFDCTPRWKSHRTQILQTQRTHRSSWPRRLAVGVRNSSRNRRKNKDAIRC
jgi:hypothetical protein